MKQEDFFIGNTNSKIFFFKKCFFKIQSARTRSTNEDNELAQL